MVIRYFLDTNAIISLFNGNRDIAGIVKDAECIRIRKNKLLKLPDAIIAAQTRMIGACLVTSDPAFKKVEGLEVFNYKNDR